MPTRTTYAAFSSRADRPLTLAGRLDLPIVADLGGQGLAAVLICHGSDGVDGRGAFHAAALNEAGLASFEIDMWAARGVVRGAAARPPRLCSLCPTPSGRSPSWPPSRRSIRSASA